jgi:hypothetical protein
MTIPHFIPDHFPAPVMTLDFDAILLQCGKSQGPYMAYPARRTVTFLQPRAPARPDLHASRDLIYLSIPVG